jgi:hypothetical protein
MSKHQAFAGLAQRFGLNSCATMLLLTLLSCGGGGSAPTSPGALAGNWQFTLVRGFPLPRTTTGASGFLSQTSNSVAGSVQIPPSSQNLKCGGVGVLSGAVDGQTVTLAINEGGTTINLSGTLSSDGKSMSGNFAGLNGGCYTSPTSGTWTASLIPPITGSFTGTITNSLYMTLLTGANPPAPIAVSGMLTQVGGTGSSNASVTGTITAVDYPCFRTASVSGTISGQNVYLLVFGFDGQQIGEIGAPPSAPATVVVQSTGVSLVGANPGTSGLALGGTSVTGSFGPCPAIVTTQGSVPYDQAAFTFSF